MKNGFMKICLANFENKVGDVYGNAELIINEAKVKNDADFVLFPQGSLAGITIGDAIFDETIYSSIELAIYNIMIKTKSVNKFIIFGTPLKMNGKLFNCAVVLYKGKILGVCPMSNIDNSNSRYFVDASHAPNIFIINKEEVKVSKSGVFACSDIAHLKFMVTMGKDLDYARIDDSVNLVLNLGDECFIAGCKTKAKTRLSYLSEFNKCALAMINPGGAESTTDVVYAGYGYIYQDGKLIARKRAFETDRAIGLIDLKNYENNNLNVQYSYDDEIIFKMRSHTTKLNKEELEKLYSKHPFAPNSEIWKNSVIDDALNIQIKSLITRMDSIGCKNLVVGVSGGLDSTLSLLVSTLAMDIKNLPHKNIIAVTMPCFGTSDLTYKNAVKLIKKLGLSFKEINIKDNVNLHFNKIGHDKSNYNVTYENAQARQRTAILMDLANDNNAIVVGTGDLSECILGWSTYNGDHMSMYNVNGGVPKTFIREIVLRLGNKISGSLKETLDSIVDTPVSPELLPSNKGEISQKTEDKVGPYELTDFFLYYMLKYRFSPSKIYEMAKVLFKDEMSASKILKWEKSFYHRFITSQYKRSCSADGPKVFEISISPRGELVMPSDMSLKTFEALLNKLK